MNCIFLILDDPDADADTKRMLWKANLTFNILYTVEASIKIIAWGWFWAGPGSYIRSGWNILDFFVVVMAWIEEIFVGADSEDGGSGVGAIRALRLLKPLKAISSIPGMRIQVSALIASIPSLLNVLMLLIFMLFLFGIMGMQLMGEGQFTQHCIKDASPCVPAPQSSEQNCASSAYDASPGAFEISPSGTCSTEGGTVYADSQCVPGLPEIADSLTGVFWPLYEMDNAENVYGLCHPVPGTGFDCPSGYTCKKVPILTLLDGESIGGNPNQGTNGFDNIGVAWLTIFQAISLEGWVDCMYMAQESGHWIIMIYWVLLILVGAMFLINLITAVIFIRFKQFKDQEEENMRQKRIAEEQAALEEMSDQLSASTVASDDKKKDKKENENLMRTNPLLRKIEQLVTKPWFNNAIIGCIIINSIIMCFEHYNQPQWCDDLMCYSNWVFSLIFTGEMVLKLLGLGFWRYVADNFNRFDGIIVIFSIFDLALGCEAQSSGFTALRAFRMLRVFKLLRFWGGLRELLETVLSTMNDLSYFTLILLLFMFIYALLGMSLFRGKYLGACAPQDPNASQALIDECSALTPKRIEIIDMDKGYDHLQCSQNSNCVWRGLTENPRANFSNFGFAMLAVFQILSGENWNELMYDGKAATGWGSVFYFITCFS